MTKVCNKPLDAVEGEHMSCICTLSQHGQASLTVHAVSCKVHKQILEFQDPILVLVICMKTTESWKYLWKVTLVAYHEIHQTCKVVPQELRSSPDKHSF
jgi:hypothetical protein